MDYSNWKPLVIAGLLGLSGGGVTGSAVSVARAEEKIVAVQEKVRDQQEQIAIVEQKVEENGKVLSAVDERTKLMLKLLEKEDD